MGSAYSQLLCRKFVLDREYWESLECIYLNGCKCRHFYVFKSFFIQCNYLLVRRYPMFYPLCIQIHVCHVGSTHVRTNRLFLIPRTNINYSQTIRAEYRKYLFIRSTSVQSLRCSSNWEHRAIRIFSSLPPRDISRIKYFLNNFTAFVITNFVNSLVFPSLGSLLFLRLLFLPPRVSPFCFFLSRLLRI